MKLLVDENIARSTGKIFSQKGFDIKYVYDDSKLRGEPDEVLFEFALENNMVILTHDLGFADPSRFKVEDLIGLVVLRFPNEITTNALNSEIARLISDLSIDDFSNLIIISPNTIRKRKLN